MGVDRSEWVGGKRWLVNDRSTQASASAMATVSALALAGAAVICQ